MKVTIQSIPDGWHICGRKPLVGLTVEVLDTQDVPQVTMLNPSNLGDALVITKVAVQEALEAQGTDVAEAARISNQICSSPWVLIDAAWCKPVAETVDT